MKHRFILFRRGGVFYCEDTTSRKQVSLRTKDEGEAQTLLHARNESVRQPILNLQIARTYLTATDPEIAARTWQAAIDEMTRDKKGPTLIRTSGRWRTKPLISSAIRPFLRRSPYSFLKSFALARSPPRIFAADS